MAAGFIASAFAATIFLSFGVLLKGLMDDFDIATTTASVILFSQWLAFGGASLGLGVLSDRIGVVTTIRVGFLLIVIGLTVSFLAFNFATFVLGFGLLTGMGMSASFGPLHNLILSASEERWKGAWLGVVMAAQGLGPFLFVPVIASLAESSGIRSVLQVLLGSGVLLLVISFLLRDTALGDRGIEDVASSDRASAIDESGSAEEGAVSAFARPNGRIAAAHLLGCASHTIPLVYIVGLGTTRGGFSLVEASSVLGVISLVSIISRLAAPIVGNVSGGVRVLRLTLPLQLVGTALFIAFADASIWWYYLAASILGLGFGSEMVLFSLIGRQLFAGRIGASLGVQLLGSGIGMGGGALLGGVLLETGSSYLGVFAWALGLGILAEIGLFTFGDQPPSELKSSETVTTGTEHVRTTKA